MTFQGSLVALITPFSNGEVDEKKLRDLVDFQVAGGTNGLVPCGTTGEAATMTDEEQWRVIEIVVDQARGRVPVMEASGSIDQASQIVIGAGPEFDVLSGDDSLTLPIMSVGGKGVISVLANIAPTPVAEMTRAFLSGDPRRAQEIHARVFGLCRALFVETNPIPVKAAAR